MTTFTLVQLIGGATLLIVGAELLVRGASRLARMLGITPLIIVLTVVAFRTSAPELAVSANAAFKGQADIAVGNVIGSNIFNILVVLGLAASIAPLTVAQQLVRVDVPLMLAASFVLLLLALDGHLNRFDGFVLVSGMAGYLWLMLREGKKESAAVKEEYERQIATGEVERISAPMSLLLVAVGFAMLVAGANWLVDAAVDIAAALGVSSLIIGLTIVAGGTSLPEVATSAIASIRGERDIAVGNAIGSNLFNILAVLGITTIIAPGGISVAPAAVNFDIPFMIAVAIACLPIFVHGHALLRFEGLIFLLYYVAYTVYLVLKASEHDALPEFSLVMRFFVVPLTLLTLVIITIRVIRQARRERGELSA